MVCLCSRPRSRWGRMAADVCVCVCVCVEEAISRDLWPLLGSSICLCPGQEKVPTNDQRETIRPTAAAAWLPSLSHSHSSLPCPLSTLPRNSASERFFVANNRHESERRSPSSSPFKQMINQTKREGGREGGRDRESVWH